MTDKLLVDRATIEQALEALELMVVDVKTTPTAYEAQRQAIAALRAALAQEQATGAWHDSDVRLYHCGLDKAAAAIRARGNT